MKIEAGKTYVDGSGNKVRVICTDRKTPGPYTVVGLQIRPNNETATHYTEEGKGWRASGLVKEYKEPSYTWINILANGKSDGAYMTRDYANQWAQHALGSWGPIHGRRIGLLKIDCETGQSENIPLEA